LIRNRVFIALLFGLVLLVQPKFLLAQQPVVTDDEVKVSTYRRFVENRVPNPAAAYEAAKDYMARYGKENDQYTRYLKTWIAAWEEDERLRKAAEARDDRQDKLLQAISQKKFADAYGQAKQVLADDPNNVKVLIPLGYGAFIASTEFHVASSKAVLSFIAMFGLTKAGANLAAGWLADAHARRPTLLIGWLVALPVPLMILWAPSWWWIVAANGLLGIIRAWPGQPP